MPFLKKFTVQDIEQRALKCHEPRWLLVARKKAMEQFQSMHLPNWKREKIKTIYFDKDFQYPQNDTIQFILKNENKESIQQGVVFCDMKTAMLERADLLEQYSDKQQEHNQDIFSLLQRAMWTNGYFLWIPNGLHFTKPFEIDIVYKDKRSSFVINNVIIADPETNIQIREYWYSKTMRLELPLCLSQTDCFAEKDAIIDFTILENFASPLKYFSTRNYQASDMANIHALHASLGKHSGQTTIHGKLKAAGSHIEHQGILIASRDQHLKQKISMTHEAPSTSGIMKYKGILNDAAYVFVDGLISVWPMAKKSSSRLEEQILLLNKNSRCDMLPALDIQTNDVSVSHSGAVSRLDEEKLFYLMSRGISRKQAKDLLVEGFFSDFLHPLKNTDLYCMIESFITQKFSSYPL